jgi:hypothetical protein
MRTKRKVSDKIMGEQNPFAKLTADKVQQIRLLPGERLSVLAALYGVSRNTVKKVRERRAWIQVEDRPWAPGEAEAVGKRLALHRLLLRPREDACALGHE